MKPIPDTFANAQRAMDAVKAGARGRYFTNCYQPERLAGCGLSAQRPGTVLYLQTEADFARLYFLTADLEDLRGALAELECGVPVVLSCLDRLPEAELAAPIRASGFEPIARYQRMTCDRLRHGRPGESLELAGAGDVDELHAALFAIFNPYTDHLPTKAQLAETIAARQVILNRQADGIRGAIVFQVAGRRVNFNHLFNRSESSLDLLRLLSHFYGVAAERGLQSGFLWVNSANEGVIRLHRSFGWRFDGLQDHFFLRRPQQANP